MQKVFVVGYSENKGGVENYIATLCKNISKEKIEIILSLPIMQIGEKKWVRPKNRHNYIKYYFFWRKFFKKNHFDAVYYNTCDIVSIDVLKFAKRAGVPIRIIHSHSTNSLRELNFWHRKQEQKNRKNLRKYATHLLACSFVAGDWMFGEGVDYTIINNAIDLASFKYSKENRERVRSELNINGNFVVGMVGALTSLKNPCFAVEVFSRISEKRKNANLLLVGEGELKEELCQQIAKYNLQDKVKLLGRRNDVSSILSATDCFLMPSKFEGFPFAMVEAQASGLPCVVSDAISQETDLTGNVHFISLDSSIDEWAKKILDACAIQEREKFAEVLKQKGYDVRENIKCVERILLNEENI